MRILICWNHFFPVVASLLQNSYYLDAIVFYKPLRFWYRERQRNRAAYLAQESEEYDVSPSTVNINLRQHSHHLNLKLLRRKSAANLRKEYNILKITVSKRFHWVYCKQRREGTVRQDRFMPLNFELWRGWTLTPIFNVSEEERSSGSLQVVAPSGCFGILDLPASLELGLKTDCGGLNCRIQFFLVALGRLRMLEYIQ